LKRKYPVYSFHLVLGGDTYRQRKAWKDFRAIREEVALIIFPRGSRSPIPNVSSTEIRSRLKK
jgi:nicotinic acid mononucleotide adenylyltransferase